MDTCKDELVGRVWREMVGRLEMTLEDAGVVGQLRGIARGTGKGGVGLWRNF